MKTQNYITHLARLTLALASLLILSACATPGAKGPNAHRITVKPGGHDRYYDPSSEEWRFED